MASEANTVSGAGGGTVRTLGARAGQQRTASPAPDQIGPAAGGVQQWYGCYGARGNLFTKESTAHPAKMAVQLAYRIFEHGRQRGYWKPGDTILDPMGGIGTTGIVGASLGYNVVLLELEYHFLLMAAANICVLRTKVGPPHFICGQCGFRVSGWNQSMDKPHLCQGCGLFAWPIEAGKVSLLQGDARQLQAVLSRAGAAITSPPYAGEPRQGTDQHPERQEGGEWSGKYQGGCHPDRLKGASHNKMAGAVASPPYGNDVAPGHVNENREKLLPPGDRMGRGLRQKGYSGAVTSPVYGDSGLQVGCSHAVRKLAAEGKWDEAIALVQSLEEDQVRRGKKRSVRSAEAIRKVIEQALVSTAEGYGSTALTTSSGARAPDAVVSSPPFLQAKGGGGIKNVKGYGDGSDKVGERTYSQGRAGSSPAQIGNLPDPRSDIERVLNIERFAELADDKETYLSAMRQVYAQLHLVLKPGGVICLVTKNPVKKGQIRRLDSDTIRLMESCGFTFLEQQGAMLAEETKHGHLFEGTVTKRTERKSFFKRLFERTCFWKGSVLESEGRQRWDKALKKFIDYRAVIERECKQEEKADGKCPYYIQDAKEDPALCPLYLPNREAGLGVDHEDILWFRK